MRIRDALPQWRKTGDTWTQAPQLWLFKHTICCCSTGNWVKQSHQKDTHPTGWFEKEGGISFPSRESYWVWVCVRKVPSINQKEAKHNASVPCICPLIVFNLALWNSHLLMLLGGCVRWLLVTRQHLEKTWLNICCCSSYLLQLGGDNDWYPLLMVPSHVVTIQSFLDVLSKTQFRYCTCLLNRTGQPTEGIAKRER